MCNTDESLHDETKEFADLGNASKNVSRLAARDKVCNELQLARSTTSNCNGEIIDGFQFDSENVCVYPQEDVNGKINEDIQSNAEMQKDLDCYQDSP